MATWEKWAIKQIRALHPNLLLAATHYDVSTAEVGSQMEATQPESASNLASFEEHVRGSVRKIITLGDPPGQLEEPADCLLASHPTMSSCSRVVPESQLDSTTDVDLAIQGLSSMLDPTPWFCTESDVCPMVVRNTVVYVDHDHITSEYALELSVLFSSSLKKAVSDAPS